MGRKSPAGSLRRGRASWAPSIESGPFILQVRLVGCRGQESHASRGLRQRRVPSSRCSRKNRVRAPSQCTEWIKLLTSTSEIGEVGDGSDENWCHPRSPGGLRTRLKALSFLSQLASLVCTAFESSSVTMSASSVSGDPSDTVSIAVLSVHMHVLRAIYPRQTR